MSTTAWAILVLVLVAALAWVGRYDIEPIGGGRTLAIKFDRWTGHMDVVGCGPQGCNTVVARSETLEVGPKDSVARSYGVDPVHPSEPH